MKRSVKRLSLAVMHGGKQRCNTRVPFFRDLDSRPVDLDVTWRHLARLKLIHPGTRTWTRRFQNQLTRTWTWRNMDLPLWNLTTSLVVSVQRLIFGCDAWWQVYKDCLWS